MRSFEWSSTVAVEFGFWFWFRFRFWIVCSKAASSGINVTRGSITRNDSTFIQIHRAYIAFGREKTEEHLHVDTTKQTWRRTHPRPPRQPIQRSKVSR